MTNNPLIKPVLKWVGGKRQLLEKINAQIPSKISTYYEPFVGGAAVLFDLQPKKARVNDSNEELINVYRTIKDYPLELIKMLKIHAKENNEEYFYRIRELDRDREEYSGLSSIEKAARIIYLNKTCYNGLFRVNNAGEFNSPWGKYKNPNIVNDTTVKALAKYLKNNDVVFSCCDYQDALQNIRRGAFVYFDPPYMPISETSSFTGYTANGFGEIQQRELKAVCDDLNMRGIKFLLSNSSCEFIRNLYIDYNIATVPAKRFINANADKRGAVDEVLIRNYE